MADVNASVTLTVNLMPKILAQLDAMAKTACYVGVPAEEAWREKVPGEKSEPINNAALAYIHDRGAPEANIPARPFLETGIQSVKAPIITRLAAAAKALGTPRAEDISVTWQAVGLIAQAGVRRKITDGPFTPLSPKYYRMRENIARGRTKLKGRAGPVIVRPLIVTGQMRASINYVIRPKGS